MERYVILERTPEGYKDAIFASPAPMREILEKHKTSYFVVNDIDAVEIDLFEIGEVERMPCSIVAQNRTFFSFERKFMHKFDWRVAITLRAVAPFNASTPTQDAICFFSQSLGFRNPFRGKNLMREIYPTPGDDFIGQSKTEAWERAKDFSKPFSFFRKGIYEDVYEIDIHAFYASIMARFPMPSGAEYYGSAPSFELISIAVTEDFKDDFGFFDLEKGQYICARNELIELQKCGAPVVETDIVKYRYKASIFPLSPFMTSFIGDTLEFEEQRHLRKMQRNAFIGNFGRKHDEDKGIKIGYYPVWINIMTIARSVMMKIFDIFGKEIIYANTDSVFVCGHPEYADLFTYISGFDWRVKNHYKKLQIDGINEYREI